MDDSPFCDNDACGASQGIFTLEEWNRRAPVSPAPTPPSREAVEKAAYELECAALADGQSDLLARSPRSAKALAALLALYVPPVPATASNAIVVMLNDEIAQRDREIAMLTQRVETSYSASASPVPTATEPCADTRRLDWLEAFTDNYVNDQAGTELCIKAKWKGVGHNNIRAAIDAAMTEAPDAK